MSKLKSYHFNLGNSSNGPIGFCARVWATSRAAAVKQLRAWIEEGNNEAEVVVHKEPLESPHSIEYVTVYFNPTAVSTKDIDEVDDVKPEDYR